MQRELCCRGNQILSLGDGFSIRLPLSPPTCPALASRRGQGSGPLGPKVAGCDCVRVCERGRRRENGAGSRGVGHRSVSEYTREAGGPTSQMDTGLRPLRRRPWGSTPPRAQPPFSALPASSLRLPQEAQRPQPPPHLPPQRPRPAQQSTPASQAETVPRRHLPPWAASGQGAADP